jgi:hypothetical protein
MSVRVPAHDAAAASRDAELLAFATECKQSWQAAG